MSEPSPDSPFAEFATKKPSALESLRARQEQERQQRGANWLLLAILVATSSTAAAVGAAVLAGPLAFPLAMAVGLAGAVAGVLVGWLIGMVTWASLVVRRRGPLPLMTPDPLAKDLTRGNTWSNMTIWLSAWAAMGIWLGAAVGASQGAIVLVEKVTVEDVGAGCFFGSLAGASLGFAAWLLIRRLRPPA
jgi:hypothetical protein